MSKVWLIQSKLVVESGGDVKLLTGGEGENIRLLCLGKRHDKDSHMQFYPVSYRTFNEETGYYTAYSIRKITEHYRMTESGMAKISLYRLLHLIATENGAIKSTEPFPRNSFFEWDAEIAIEKYSGGSYAWVYIYPNKNNKSTAFSIALHLIGSYQYYNRLYLYEEYCDKDYIKSSQDNFYNYLCRLRCVLPPVPANRSLETILKYN